MSANHRPAARTTALTIGALLIALLVVWFIARGPARADAAPSANEHRLLTFSGSGTAQIAPDSATISAGVTGAGDSANAAQAAASRKMDALVRHLKGEGLAARQLQTSDASVAEDWEHEGRFLANQSLTIDVDDPTRAGKLLGEATAGGAESVSGPSFGLKDQRAGYAEALRQAIADARAKADAAAGQMDAEVTGVYSVGEASQGGGIPMYAAKADMATAASAAVDVPVEQGTQAVSLDVEVAFTYTR